MISSIKLWFRSEILQISNKINSHLELFYRFLWFEVDYFRFHELIYAWKQLQVVINKFPTFLANFDIYKFESRLIPLSANSWRSPYVGTFNQHFDW